MTEMPASDRRPAVGISSCLLGEKVRYNGEGRLHPFLVERLGEFFRWVSVCPEVEVGLGVPREPIDLHRIEGEIRLIASRTRRDLTAAMQAYAGRRLDALVAESLRGYVLKSRSPSCGIASAPLLEEGRATGESADGLFARALRARFPALPLAEEAWFTDPERAKIFIARVFAYDQWRGLREGNPTLAALARFHAAHALLLRASDPRESDSLERMADGPIPAGVAIERFLDEYERRFFGALGASAFDRSP